MTKTKSKFAVKINHVQQQADDQERRGRRLLAREERLLLEPGLHQGRLQRLAQRREHSRETGPGGGAVLQQSRGVSGPVGRKAVLLQGLLWGYADPAALLPERRLHRTPPRRL